MENVVLSIHLILALCLVGVVLLQRSEGGGLGMGSTGGVMTGRGAATALAKVTWGLAAAFIATSIALTVFAARDASQRSVIDQIGGTVPDVTAPATSGLGGDGKSLLPPSTDGTTGTTGTTTDGTAPRND